MTTAATPHVKGRHRVHDHRLPGILITIDGPGGVGKSTIAGSVAMALAERAVPVRSTAEPNRTPLDEHARAGPENLSGHGARHAWSPLTASHHHLACEILPAHLGSTGWPVTALDCTHRPPETIAATITNRVLHLHAERSQA